MQPRRFTGGVSLGHGAVILLDRTSPTVVCACPVGNDSSQFERAVNNPDVHEDKVGCGQFLHARLHR